MESIEIYSSKQKSALILIGSIAFVIIGIYLFVDAYNVTHWRSNNPVITRIIAVIDILFFGIGIFFAGQRIIKSRVAIKIDSKGITLNPKKNELIEWEYILGFREVKIRSTRILIIGVTNPEYWIERESNIIKKKIMKFNFESFDSPFNVSAAGLNTNFDELNKQLNYYFKKSKNEA